MNAVLSEAAGLFGLDDANGYEIYPPIFLLREAEELERLHNLNEPPDSFAEAILMAERNGVEIHSIL